MRRLGRDRVFVVSLVVAVAAVLIGLVLSLGTAAAPAADAQELIDAAAHVEVDTRDVQLG